MTETTTERRGAVTSTFAPRDVAVLASLAVMWGLSFLFIKVAVDVVAPLWIVAARCAVGGLILVVILRVRGARLPRGRRIWIDLTILAALGNALPWGLMAWATQYLPSGLVAVVNALAPSSTLIIAILVGLEAASIRRAVGLVIALSGTALAVSSSVGSPGTALAAVTVGLATVCYGAGSVYAKQRVSGTHPPLAIATGQVLMAAAMSIPVAAVAAPLPVVADITPAIWGSLLALGVFGTGLAFRAFYTLIASVGATNTVMVTYLIPVVALLAGALVLREPITLVVVAGTALTIFGIWLAQRQRSVSVPEHVTELPR
ncbi:DMT family transporter [Nitriliruptor alkaliphilus]|uniref:DMT family transporter n=1 Tax=Nitriliruptor alkaliphilus TaxID=427918 RepID=UPI000698D1CB|nr:DMT family transporter [Nitriliruptor alkaliphilus]